METELQAAGTGRTQRGCAELRRKEGVEQRADSHKVDDKHMPSRFKLIEIRYLPNCWFFPPRGYNRLHIDLTVVPCISLFTKTKVTHMRKVTMLSSCQMGEFGPNTNKSAE